MNAIYTDRNIRILECTESEYFAKVVSVKEGASVSFVENEVIRNGETIPYVSLIVRIDDKTRHITLPSNYFSRISKNVLPKNNS